jgi:TrmH family RNA methyltransferase
MKITSASNPMVKHVKSLHKKRARWKSKSFFVEGVKGVEEAIKSNSIIECILYSDTLFEVNGGKELLNLINKTELKILYTDKRIIEEISDTENPQGIIAIVKFNEYSLKEILKSENNSLILLDRLQDPGNIGTIIRTADAFGIDGVILTKGCVDVYNPKVVRSTMGSLFRVPMVFVDDTIDTLKFLKKEGIKIISSTLDTEEFCYDVDFNQNFALVVGNEATGISYDIINFSDYNIKIPMSGETESLNAAVAASIIMYEAFKQRKNFKTN